MNDAPISPPDDAPSPVMGGERHDLFDDVQALLTGTLVAAIGLVFLKHAGLLTGGTTGIAFLVHYFTGSNFGLTLFLINTPFYLLAWWRLGPAFTIKTLASVALLSALVEVLPKVIVLQFVAPWFAGAAGGLLLGLGILILFRHRASLGGLNILVIYLQERYGWRAGKVQMGIDIAILAAASLRLPLPLLAASVLGAVLLNFVLAVNHKPGRYMAF